jgi:hypothetical protein
VALEPLIAELVSDLGSVWVVPQTDTPPIPGCLFGIHSSAA